MFAEQDPITPPEFSDTLVKYVRPESSTYLKFEECGHGVVADKPEEVLNADHSLVSDVVSKTGDPPDPFPLHFYKREPLRLSVRFCKIQCWHGALPRKLGLARLKVYEVLKFKGNLSRDTNQAV